MDIQPFHIVCGLELLLAAGILYGVFLLIGRFARRR